MPVGDIRPIKAGLREQYKRLRRNMPREIQDAYDETIARRVAALWPYKRCRMLLTYVSTAIEVDTRRIIERALADGLQVVDASAFALCRDNGLTRRVFGMGEPGNITRALLGERIGTLVSCD